MNSKKLTSNLKQYFAGIKYLIFNILGILFGLMLFVIGIGNIISFYEIRSLDEDEIYNFSGLVDRIIISKRYDSDKNDTIYSGLEVRLMNDYKHYELDIAFKYLYDSIFQNFRQNDNIELGILQDGILQNNIVIIKRDKNILSFNDFKQIKSRKHSVGFVILIASLLIVYWSIKVLRLQRKRYRR